MTGKNNRGVGRSDDIAGTAEAERFYDIPRIVRDKGCFRAARARLGELARFVFVDPEQGQRFIKGKTEAERTRVGNGLIRNRRLWLLMYAASGENNSQCRVSEHTNGLHGLLPPSMLYSKILVEI